MADLTDDELRAIAYYSVGVSSEGKDVAYQLSFAGDVIHKSDGSVFLKPVANSGYSIGTLQSDLGQHHDIADALVRSFQDWAKANRPEWALSDQHMTPFAAELGRTGHHIRDKNYEHDLRTHIAIPESGQDIDQDFKAHLNAYLTTDAGKTFVHQQDVIQVLELMRVVADTLKDADFYQKAAPEDQAKIFAVTAKAYNQSPGWGIDILNDIADGHIHSLNDISKKIDTLPDYMQTGRDDALQGAKVFNTLRNASERNVMHEPWRAVTADPLINPTQLGANPQQPHLAHQYATVKAAFVDPKQGRAFVEALEKGASHNYGDPTSDRSRGFYAQGNDFVQWDRNGQGRAFVGGQWSDFSRDEIALARHHDHTLDITLTRNGETHSLLHVTHPTLGHAPASHARETTASTLHLGAHGEAANTLQTQLNELGYLNASPDSHFGPATKAAVQTFQHAHGLPADGKVGPATQHSLQADVAMLQQHSPATFPSMPVASGPGLDDPRNALNPNHTLYNELKTRIPDASEQRLLQFTAACHSHEITAENLGRIYFDQQGGHMTFTASWPPGPPATVDVKIPSPETQQSIQHIQQYDQQQTQMMSEIRQQNAQINAQAQQRPMPGGP